MNRLVLAGLRSPLHGLFDGGTIGLRYLSTGRGEVTLPVGYVRCGTDLVVLVAGSSKKMWWRHFRTSKPVDVWWQGAWRPTSGRVCAFGTPEYLGPAIAYRNKHPRMRTSRDPFVLITAPVVLDATPQSSARI